MLLHCHHVQKEESVAPPRVSATHKRAPSDTELEGSPLAKAFRAASVDIATAAANVSLS